MHAKKRQFNFFRILTFTLMFLLTVNIALLAEDKKDVEPEGCTSIFVGKGGTVDGSTITSHTCDSGTDRTWINVVPRKKHKAGSMCKIYTRSKRTEGPNDKNRIVAGEIPQAAETYAYINTAYAVMNEYQLAIGETTIGQNRKLYSSNGIIDCPELYRLVLERAKTAREAIKIADQITKEYGYIDTGECFTFADPQEVWHFEIFGPGFGRKGALWAAVRIPDDHAGVSANASRIRTLDLNDKENFMASENIEKIAAELKLWDPKSGKPFEVCYAFGNRNRMSSRRREWVVLNKIAPSLKLHPNSENYPFSVKVEKKLSAQDVVEMFRNYFQGTEFDFTKDMMTKNRRGKLEQSPIAGPFLNYELKKLLKIKSERSVACERATYVQVTQSRSWLPDAIGGVVWLGYDNPVLTPHTPFYCGISKMPASYMVDGRRKFSRDCAWWAYRRVCQLSKNRWQPMSADVTKVWKEIEEGAFKNQEKFEKKALALYKKSPKKAKKLLTRYCLDLANEAVRKYWDLGDELWAKYNRYF